MTENLSGREIVTALDRNGFHIVRRSGSHAVLKWKSPDDEKIRTVTVPLHGPLNQETLRNIAEQCGAKDFAEWKSWISNAVEE